jgi:ferredoxin-thioredoxin reductase catalytic subunit/rubredoxin
MSKEKDVTAEEINSLYQTLDKEGNAGGYHLNPDVDFTKELIKGLIVNEKRYGYRACPCRLASGKKEEDLDIVCPCDYRDSDLNDYDACYCGLYVSKRILSGEQKVEAIPERRPPLKERKTTTQIPSTITSLSKPVWRCRVCGYLCARDEPPEVCPICKVQKDRFERFL